MNANNFPNKNFGAYNNNNNYQQVNNQYNNLNLNNPQNNGTNVNKNFNYDFNFQNTNSNNQFNNGMNNQQGGFAPNQYNNFTQGQQQTIAQQPLANQQQQQPKQFPHHQRSGSNVPNQPPIQQNQFNQIVNPQQTGFNNNQAVTFQNQQGQQVPIQQNYQQQQIPSLPPQIPNQQPQFNQPPQYNQQNNNNNNYINNNNNYNNSNYNNQNGFNNSMENRSIPNNNGQGFQNDYKGQQQYMQQQQQQQQYQNNVPLKQIIQTPIPPQNQVNTQPIQEVQKQEYKQNSWGKEYNKIEAFAGIRLNIPDFVSVDLLNELISAMNKIRNEIDVRLQSSSQGEVYSKHIQETFVKINKKILLPYFPKNNKNQEKIVNEQNNNGQPNENTEEKKDKKPNPPKNPKQTTEDKNAKQKQIGSEKKVKNIKDINDNVPKVKQEQNILSTFEQFKREQDKIYDQSLKNKPKDKDSQSQASRKSVKSEFEFNISTFKADKSNSNKMKSLLSKMITQLQLFALNQQSLILSYDIYIIGQDFSEFPSLKIDDIRLSLEEKSIDIFGSPSRITQIETQNQSTLKTIAYSYFLQQLCLNDQNSIKAFIKKQLQHLRLGDNVSYYSHRILRLIILYFYVNANETENYKETNKTYLKTIFEYKQIQELFLHLLMKLIILNFKGKKEEKSSKFLRELAEGNYTDHLKICKELTASCGFNITLFDDKQTIAFKSKIDTNQADDVFIYFTQKISFSSQNTETVLVSSLTDIQSSIILQNLENAALKKKANATDETPKQLQQGESVKNYDFLKEMNS